MFADHVVLSSEGRVALYTDELELLSVVRTVARIGRERLVSFGVVDDHAHLLVRAGQGRWVARDLRFALRGAVRPALDAFVKPVRERAHFLRLLTYLLEQPRKHDLPVHPAAWGGSCFPDLAGARRLAGFDASLCHQLVPRFQIASANATVGLGGAGIGPASLDEVAASGLRELVASGAAAIGDVALCGRRRDRVAARVAVVDLGLRAGFRPSDLASTLLVGNSTVRRLRFSPLLDEGVTSAILRQVRLRRLVRGTR